MIQLRFLTKKRKFYEKLNVKPDEDNLHHQTKIQDIGISFFNKKYPKLTTSERKKCEVEINEHMCAEAVTKFC